MKMNVVSYESFINEGNETKTNVYKKIHGDLSLQFYFMVTFNTSILGLYPLVEKLLFNGELDLNFTSYQIVLLTIFGVAEMTHHLKDSNIIKDLLEKEGITEHIGKIKKILLSLKTLFMGVLRSFGKTLDKFVDMLGYVALIVPFNVVLLHLTSDYNLDYTTLWKIAIYGTMSAAGIFTLKNIVREIVSNLKTFFRKNESLEFNDDDFDYEEFDEKFDEIPSFLTERDVEIA